MADEQPPNGVYAGALERLGEAFYDLLHARALSIGVMDIDLEQEGWYVDAELLFSVGPDMGISFDGRSGVCRYCELIGDDEERWLEHEVAGIDVANEPAKDVALALLSGMLDARRPLLRTVEDE